MEKMVVQSNKTQTIIGLNIDKKSIKNNRFSIFFDTIN